MCTAKSFIPSKIIPFLMVLSFSPQLIAQQPQKNSKDEVVIGAKTWMKRNLDTDKFRNGDPIPEATSAEAWQQAGAEGKPAWCYYDNDPANGKLYGKLYNWFAVNDPRGLAPEGWHVATEEEWMALESRFKATSGLALKSRTGWEGKVPSNNKSGFTALPGGDRVIDGSFHGKGKVGSWWTSTRNTSFESWDFYLNYRNGYLDKDFNSNENGFAVRCVKDPVPAPPKQ